MTDKHISGLTSEEVVKSREQYGENLITPVKRESIWKLFIGKFNDPIIKILIVAAILSLGISFIDGHFAETIGIFCAIFLATGVSFWFEYDAKKRFEILNTVNDDTPVKVIRNDEIQEIPKREVVVGDIVVINSGDEVPADGKLLEAVSLKINESTLTGEPVISKTTDLDKFSEDATYPSNMAMRGTSVSEGHGIVEITAVGDSTEYGKVSEQSTIESDEKTPLNKQLSRLSKIISRVGSALAIFVFLILIVKGSLEGDLFNGDWFHTASEVLQYFMVSVAIMVMAIPEGLPMSITLSLAMSMRRMLKTNNLVRKMHACETMGAVTVICTDKTGTLTRNEMRVSEFAKYNEISDELLDELISVNSTAYLDHDKKVIGNPTEGALLLWMDNRGIDYDDYREKVEIIDQITFTTEKKFMATLAISSVTGKRTLYIKGAPEIVLQMTDDENIAGQINEKLQLYQNKAMRTLGFAMAETSAENCGKAIEQRGLRFIGISAISDPVRDDVPAAVEQCLSAGINIKIVTGDTPATAKEIARQIGLWNDDIETESNHITGVDFEKKTDEQLLEIIGNIKIMSRARPLDKQRLVKLLQQKGEVVAVTGDGTNDAPALNFAQVGLSMGSGTSVAKEASDITLLDDSFSSIATAVMWGRSLYKNIQRFVMFQLTVNFAALIIVFFGSIFGGELPLTVTQILWVNLIMDTFAAMALASLPPDPKVMDEKPRAEKDFIITREMLKWIIGVGSVIVAVLMFMLLRWGDSATEYQLSLFFTIFVLLQFWNLLNARAFGTRHSTSSKMAKGRGFCLILLVILIGQIIIVTYGDGVFRTVPLNIKDWILIIAGTSIVAIGGSAVRFFQRNNNIFKK